MKIQQLLVVGTLAVSALAAQAQVISRWNFNGGSATTVPGGELSPTPATGTGTASLFGGATATASFGSGISNGGSSDPVVTVPANYGWQTSTYGANTNAGNAGVQFLVSSVGYTSSAYESFTFSYDLRHSNTSSRYEQVQYTIDGSTWTNAGTYFDGNAGDTWFNGRTVSITDPAAFDNAAFGLRITTSNGPGSVLAASSTTYSTAGTWRFDMVTLSAVATPVPEPSSYAALAGGFTLACVALRRRRA